MRSSKIMSGLFAAVVMALLAGAASAQIPIATVPVGNPGNAPDTTGFGSVPYSYNIGQYDVTAGQYTAFLNAVASTDTYGLYNSRMFSGLNGTLISAITQSGSSGSYTYTDTRNPNYPMNDVTWGDAARFCNWLTNGQPTGAEGNGTTETGSYTLNGAITDAALNAVTRNANADYVIPTENEWYKAAYYNPSSSSYYLYPTKSNSQPSNVLSATGTNNANYNDNGFAYTDPTNYLTTVGAFADSASPYGTYGQGGDVWQWNESVYFGSSRGMRGGSFYNYGSELQSGVASSYGPTAVFYTFGFRVSQVPEPASVGLLAVGSLALLVRGRRKMKLTGKAGLHVAEN
jgi:formylglycine-generating enzyme required for sulfatase activity